jgi:hypothetical protein
VAAQVDFLRVSAPSGHYQYKSWRQNAQGERVAQKHFGLGASTQADLAANYYSNSNKTQTVFGIAFDLDAHRAKDCFKDAEGKLDWNLIQPALQKEIPEVAALMCYVVRSTGGKGLGIVMAISPLVILQSTTLNQQSALKLQGRLLSVFDKMGIGADFGARGILRDLPNFKNPDKLIFQNQKILRELETARRSVVSELHKLLNERDKAARENERLYNDERVEKGLSKLVLWLLGAMNFDRSVVFDGQVIETKFPKIPYLSGWQMTISLRELISLTGLSEVFLRKFLSAPPKWLKANSCAKEGWSLCIPLSKSVPWLLERSFYLMQKPQELTGTDSFNPQELPMPFFVQDGERNAWIVNLALLYKWAGYSQECTLKKVTLRVQGIPGYETSRNCKLIPSIVRSLFRRQPETLGIRERNTLPDWILDDTLFRNTFKRVSARRGATPVVSLVPVPLAAVLTIPCLQTLGELFQNNDETKRETKVFLVVRRNQRVGIFEGEKLILCVTKKHYKASRMLMHLAQSHGGLNIRLVSPRKSKQETFFEAVDNSEFVLKGDDICGRKETRAEAFQKWRERKGLHEVRREMEQSGNFKEPF